MSHKKLSSSHEVNHALRQELEFKATARRNKLIGYWLADMIGLNEADANALAIEIVHADFEEPGEEDVVRKAMDVISSHALDVSQEALRAEMSHLLCVARGQIEDEQ
ncbi:MAG: DUF1476 domain-containing protein [Alphaproteobacteria bacterium]|nr:DUF1476 domain-containing protein [Alphaproteobacteria bacterium]